MSLLVLKVRSKQKLTLFFLSLNCHFLLLSGVPMSWCFAYWLLLLVKHCYSFTLDIGQLFQKCPERGIWHKTPLAKTQCHHFCLLSHCSLCSQRKKYTLLDTILLILKVTPKTYLDESFLRWLFLLSNYKRAADNEFRWTFLCCRCL